MCRQVKHDSSHISVFLLNTLQILINFALLKLTKIMSIKTDVLDNVTIKFAGDSGDGMQLTGTQFTNTAALFGNDLSTFPDFPAEIRAPQGTLAGVSGYQLHFGSVEIFTPGDK